MKTSKTAEVRFRVATLDRKRLEWLLRYHPNHYESISALIRALITQEYEALSNVTTLQAKED